MANKVTSTPRLTNPSVNREANCSQGPYRRGGTRQEIGARIATRMGQSCRQRACLAILVLVGEIDPQGTRRVGLDAFLDEKVEEGYVIETRTETHAIISRRPKGLKRFTSGADPGRYVVEVDEDGTATMRSAEPRRS